MTLRQRKACFFILEGTNSFATTYYFSYLFFFLHEHFQFGDKQNLLASTLHGLVYMLTAWNGGRFAERRGFLTSLRVGFAGMGLVHVFGLFADSAMLKVLCIGVWTFFMTFTWPALQALLSQGESDETLPGVLGAYNCIWACVSACSLFAGGALYQYLGAASLYWLPALIHAAQFFFTGWLAKQPGMNEGRLPAAPAPPHEPEAVSATQPLSPATFLKMAWLANPFAYVAINTAMALMPDLAARLGLTVAQSGLYCSVWFFARFLAFVGLWHWTGWHYRFRWMVSAFVALAVGFATLLLARQLWLFVAAQVVFGLATGLLYYSSLFYSMDVGEAKGKSGGIHESALGSGIFLGPAIGSAALYVAPGQPRAGIWAVSGALVIGLVILIWMRVRFARKAAAGDQV
jgi:predicted MFS family arabinose efflux permease